MLIYIYSAIGEFVLEGRDIIYLVPWESHVMEGKDITCLESSCTGRVYIKYLNSAMGESDIGSEIYQIT